MAPRLVEHQTSGVASIAMEPMQKLKISQQIAPRWGFTQSSRSTWPDRLVIATSHCGRDTPESRVIAPMYRQDAALHSLIRGSYRGESCRLKKEEHQLQEND